MRKEEILKLLAQRSGISTDEAKDFYDKFIARLTRILQNRNAIKISGFGDFKVKVRKEKRVVDPRRGIEKVIPAKLVVNFLPSKILSEKINVRYISLKPVVLKKTPPIFEAKEVDEFNLTFFEPEEQKEKVKEKKLFFEEVKVYEPVVEEINSDEDYLSVAKFEFEPIDTKGVDFEISVSKVLDLKEEKTFFTEPIKTKVEEFEMPEFNLTDEPEKSEKSSTGGEEKEDLRKIFDDTKSTKKEETPMVYDYEEETPRRTGFWIFIIVVFVIFIAGVIFLLNQYGYINLFGKAEKGTAKVDVRQPEEIIVTTPEVPAKPEKPAVEKEEVGKSTEITKVPAEAVKKPKLGKSFVIQVASFQDKGLADEFARSLRRKGYNAFVERAFVEWKGGNWYRVRVGFFDSIEQANAVAQKLKRDEKLERIWISEATRNITK